MTFTLGQFFPKKIVNEPMLNLDDPRWAELEGGYKGNTYDASPALKQLEKANTLADIKATYEELWAELHHQGDVSLASYYSVPHLIRIAKEKQLVDFNVLSLVTVIEIQRHKNNPALPKALTPAYQKALTELSELAALTLTRHWDLEIASSALAAIAVAKGQLKLANVILNLDEGEIDELTERW